jgi:hypothetical protein
MASLPPFLNLAGELRNTIYELVLLNTPLRVFEGRTILPPLGYVCRQIHGEMSGVFEKHKEDLILDFQSGRLPINARIINYDFVALYEWLQRNEGTNDATTSAQQVRALHIDLVIDVPVIDLTRVKESQLTIQKHIARDREVIESLNNSWDDAGYHDYPPRRSNFHDGPHITGRYGTAAIVDGYGAKSYGLKTVLGNCYVVTCNVRLNFFSHSNATLSGPSPGGFCHQGDYLDQLFGQTPDGGPLSPGHTWGRFIMFYDLYMDDPVCPFFKVVFGGMCRARAGSYRMLWDNRYYSQLTRQQQSVVEYYRFLDGGIERRGFSEPVQKYVIRKSPATTSKYFEKLDAAARMEDRMDLRKR